MFILNSKRMGEFDLNKAKQFVQYWGKQYSFASVKVYNTNEVIDYLEELNLGTPLTENNIKRLLRWKDHRMLTGNNGVRLHKFTFSPESVWYKRRDEAQASSLV